MIYGAVILTCFGALPWLARYLDFGLFPLRWNMTRPVSAAPFDLIFVLLVMPFTIGKTRPRRIVRELLSQWIALTSHQLRLSSYMLGVRRADEEGTHVRKTWRDRLLCKRAVSPLWSSALAQKHTSSVDFVKDGEFRRVPAMDGVKIVQKCMLLTVNEDGTPIDEDGARGIKEQLEKGNIDTNFTVVYVPPHFKTRILLFIYLLGFTGSLAIFSSIALPREHMPQMRPACDPKLTILVCGVTGRKYSSGASSWIASSASRCMIPTAFLLAFMSFSPFRTSVPRGSDDHLRTVSCHLSRSRWTGRASEST